jgi:hypothetical protein
MSNKRFNKDKSFEYVKKSPFNTHKRTMIISPDEGILPIEDYGKGKNFPGKIIRVLNAKGGRVRDKQPPKTKKYFRSTKSGAGMTKAGVARYRRENPGSKLKTAVTGKVKPGSKAANRRKSYCARSLGQLKRSSAKTRNDPNSRIRQARRRWKC